MKGKGCQERVPDSIKPKNDETKLDRGKRHGWHEDTRIFWGNGQPKRSVMDGQMGHLPRTKQWESKPPSSTDSAAPGFRYREYLLS